MPLWVKILVVVSVFPLLCLPLLLSGDVETDMGKMLLRIYPVMVLLCAWCAWKVWKQNETLTHILIVLQWLIHGSMWLLCHPLQ